MCLIAKAVGISYDDLIAMILRYGIRRARIRPQRSRAPIPGIQAPAPPPGEVEPELPLVGT